jgi:hypothetical protein
VADPGRSLAERLAALVDDTAAGLDQIDIRSAGEVVEFLVAGRVFAVRHGGALEVDLGPAVASAAIRTADTAPSDRGPAWVRFTPRVLDRFGSDRVRAWFRGRVATRQRPLTLRRLGS